MRETEAKSVRCFTEDIGSDGAVMEIRLETNGERKKVYAKVMKDGREVAFASREESGEIILSVKRQSELTGEEYLDVFRKSGLCIAQLAGIELPEEPVASEN